MHRNTNIEASRFAPLPSNTKTNLKNIKCRYLNTCKCNSSLSSLKCPDFEYLKNKTVNYTTFTHRNYIWGTRKLLKCLPEMRQFESQRQLRASDIIYN